MVMMVNYRVHFKSMDLCFVQMNHIQGVVKNALLQGIISIQGHIHSPSHVL